MQKLYQSHHKYIYILYYIIVDLVIESCKPLYSITCKQNLNGSISIFIIRCGKWISILIAGQWRPIKICDPHKWERMTIGKPLSNCSRNFCISVVSVDGLILKIPTPFSNFNYFSGQYCNRSNHKCNPMQSLMSTYEWKPRS